MAARTCHGRCSDRLSDAGPEPWEGDGFHCGSNRLVHERTVAEFAMFHQEHRRSRRQKRIHCVTQNHRNSHRRSGDQEWNGPGVPRGNYFRITHEQFSVMRFPDEPLGHSYPPIQSGGYRSGRYRHP